MREIKNSLERHGFLLVVLCWVLFLIWSSGILTAISPNLDSYNLRIITDFSNIESLLLTMAEVLGAVLAIFFSISIIVVQHAASNYTASILEGYKTDRKTWFVFLFYLVSIALTIVSLQNIANYYMINLTVVTFAFSFVFLASQFLHIIDMINPTMMIENAKNQSLKEIRKIAPKLESILEKKKPMTDFERQILKTTSYRDFLFHSDKTLLAPLKHKVLQISDVIQKTSSRKELETSIVGFNALSKIARSYIDLRQDDTTPRDDFIQYIYEQLLTVFEIAIDNKDTSLMIETIRAFEKVGCSTTDIKSISIFGGPHQSTSLAVWNINILGTNAIKKNFFDVAAQAISSLKVIGTYAIQKTNGDGLASNKIFEIGTLAIAKGDWFVLGHAFEGLKELLFISISKRIGIHKEPSSIFEKIEKLAGMGIKSNLAYYALQSSLFPILPEFSIQKISWMAFQIKNEKYPKIQTSSREEYSKRIMSKLIQTLGTIAELAAKNRSLLLLGRTIDYILRIAISSLKEDLITIKEGYKDEVNNTIEKLKRSYSLVSSYLLDAGVHSSIPHEIEDAITSIAIHSIDSDQIELSISCLKAIEQMSVAFIERDSYGYDVARCAGRIGIIGAYALHKKKKDIANKAAELLVDFDSIYLKKSPKPQDGFHINEMRRLHRNFNKEDFLPSFGQEVYGALFKKVPARTLNRFARLYKKKRGISEQ